MKVVVFEAEERELAAFDSVKGTNKVFLVSDQLRLENAEQNSDAEIVSTFIYSRLDRDVLSKFSALRLIATRSTGFDHIDIDFCKKHGITVCNVPTYGECTVAEHVFALLLAISHRLPEASERARSGHFSPEGLQGFDLAGKTLGVVGTGHIGRHVARIAKGFEMNVVACDVCPDAKLASALGFHYLPFEKMLGMSDVISLHVPATHETENMLDVKAFDQMKSGVVVINTARGNLIDMRALIQNLRSGKVVGAGLDVLPDEPMIREEAELICAVKGDERDLRNLVANHVLMTMPNVVVTPHSAFNTRESVGRIVKTTMENIEAFLIGHPQNVVC